MNTTNTPAPAATEAPSGFKSVPMVLSDAFVAQVCNHGVWTAQEVRNLHADLMAATPAPAVGASVQPVPEDPLQGAANWLMKALVPCSAIEIGWRLSIGHNRAQRLRDNATGVQPVQASLSDEQIEDLADDFKSQYTHAGTTFDEFDYMGFGRAVRDRALASSTPTKGGAS